MDALEYTRITKDMCKYYGSYCEKEGMECPANSENNNHCLVDPADYFFNPEIAVEVVRFWIENNN